MHTLCLLTRFRPGADLRLPPWMAERAAESVETSESVPTLRWMDWPSARARLAPKILAARSAHFTPRVIFVSSVGHGLGTGVNFNTLGHPDPELYEGMEAYYQAKAANVLTAIELSRRAKGKINAYSLHPGAIYTKIMQTDAAIAGLHKLGYLTADGQPIDESKFKTIAQGAATTLVAALEPALNETPGAYLCDCVLANELIAPHSSDPANAEKLWNMTEHIIGKPFVL
ncbi:hypothetical protein DFH06DRAFT_1466665 [Mycena polygramma]|nr:hypothetical protein DFH06DRAFT_1466665 [Mycena polygramma]